MNNHLLLEHRETLRAAIERIVPADEFPGGWEAGAGDYILGLLAGDCASLVPLYEKGLAGVDAEAQEAHGRQFAELAPVEQDEILQKVEADEVATQWPVRPREFFERLVCQTMEGFWGDPGNGGNRGEISWRMVGFTVTA